MDQDTRRRAEEILLSSAYTSSAKTPDRYRPDKHRWKKKFFSPEEKAKILDRVKTVGVTQAAREAGTWPDIVTRWLDDIDKMIAETDALDLTDSQVMNITPTQEEKGTEEMKKSKDFTPAELDAIVARAAEVGAKKAAEEAGTSHQVVAGLMKRMKRKKPIPEKTVDKVIPGQNGLPAKRNNSRDYTHEERRLIVAKANEVGIPTVRTAYDLRKNTLFDWRKAVILQDKRRNIEAKTINVVKVIPGQNGLPAKRDAPQDYTAEERKIIVAKADEVGNPQVKNAYGFNNDYIIHDWRRSLIRQAKRDEKETIKAATQAVHSEKTAEPERQDKNVIIPEAPKMLTLPSPVANYPLEVEVILLREKVAALTEQIERLRSVVATLI